MGKYDPLDSWFDQIHGDEIVDSDELPKTTGIDFPQSARKHPAWWSAQAHNRWTALGWTARSSTAGASGSRARGEPDRLALRAASADGTPLRDRRGPDPAWVCEVQADRTLRGERSIRLGALEGSATPCRSDRQALGHPLRSTVSSCPMSCSIRMNSISRREDP